LGVLMPETEDGTQGLPKKPAPDEAYMPSVRASVRTTLEARASRPQRRSWVGSAGVPPAAACSWVGSAGVPPAAACSWVGSAGVPPAAALLGWECGRPARRGSRLGAQASCPQRRSWAGSADVPPAAACSWAGSAGVAPAEAGWERGRRARIGVKHCVGHAPPNTRRNHDCCPTTCSCAGTSVRHESKAF
jgi:hypothetical protein